MHSRLAAIGLLSVTAIHAQPLPAAASAVIQRYCSGCHSPQMKKGGLVLDPAADVAAHPVEWEKVIRRLNARSMPPAGLPRPAEQGYTQLTAALESTLDRAAAARPNPGRTDTFRRLNRTEYQNAIRDLLDLEVDVAALLPADESSRGFDNITVGDLSPTLLERYLGAARKISRLAVGVAPRAPGGETITFPPDLTQEEHMPGMPLGTRGGASVKHTFPVDAEYEIQIRLQRDRNEHVEGLREPCDVEVSFDGRRIGLFTVKPPKPGQDHSLVDVGLEVRLPVKAGVHTITAAFPRPALTLLETERQPYQAHFNMDRHPRIRPALYSISINGPYGDRAAGESPSRKRIFTCRPGGARTTDSCAEAILTPVIRRAYRRPVTPADLAAPMKFFRESSAEGFDTGIEMALRSILVSPEFLFRVEQDPAGVAPGAAYRLSDLALASRLSFFLWSSIPDDELLDLAAAGKLQSPGVLDRQVRRMLADRRSASLVTNFANQWLHLRNLASMTPDMRLFPDFDDNLRQAFRTETELFFESIVKEDRGILDLLRADYTFLNERLAKHYGVPNIYGSRFRRVDFGPDGPRGGLLRHGSILTVTSYATRTSPVIRGKWILDNLLGVPPPPPPPSVPALREKSNSGKILTMRERLAEHRDNPACSGCHQLMDPVGFSLENYDAIGRWRTVDNAAPVDAAGGLPDGSSFDGVVGLRNALLKNPGMLATNFSEKLMTYALGRGVEASDAPAIRVIVRSAQPDYKFSSIVTAIVKSEPFQMRRAQ